MFLPRCLFPAVPIARGRADARYAEVGHNTLDRLILLWIIPNGAWIVVPGILTWKFGVEIMQRLDARKEIKRQ